MEYLTLQDIPHRHYNPLHSHRMSSSQYTERPMGSLAAVCETFLRVDSQEMTARTSSHLPPLSPRIQSTVVASAPILGQERNTRRYSSFPTNWHPLHHPLAYDDQNFGRRWLSAADAEPRYLQARAQHTFNKNDIRDKFLMNLQNTHSRSSPPIQPNEHGFADKLPSFSEVSHVGFASSGMY
jgi:hypothetical protein